MKTTPESGRKQRPEAEYDRERAWVHLLESPGGIRRIPRHGRHGSARRLIEIARAFDRICQRAEGHLEPDATPTDVLAALLVIRTLREKLDSDELLLMNLARTKKVTWARIADTLEMRSRQSAERRHLQLSRAYTRSDGTAPGTQSERVEQAREHRSRRAERRWAMQHADVIRRLARRLAAVEDLQQRVDRSAESRILTALRGPRPTSTPDRAQPVSLVWPKALRSCLTEDDQFRSDPQGFSSAADPVWQREKKETDIVHRLLGLISYAANPRNIDLSDLPELARSIADVYAQSQPQTRTRS